jgi:hypothetical protein
MSQPIAIALEALALAKECGGELDLDFYARTHQELSNLIETVRSHDRNIMSAEASPTGADYEHLMQLLGLRAEAVTDAPSIAEKEGA